MLNTQANNPRRMGGLNGDSASSACRLYRPRRRQNSGRLILHGLVARWRTAPRFLAGLLLACTVAAIGCATGSTSAPLTTRTNMPSNAWDALEKTEQVSESDPTPDDHVTTRRSDTEPSAQAVVRGQDAWPTNPTSPGSTGHLRYPMTASQADHPPETTGAADRSAMPPASANSYPTSNNTIRQPTPPTNDIPSTNGSSSGIAPPAAADDMPSLPPASDSPWLTSPFLGGDSINNTPSIDQLPGTPLPVNVRVQEARTGRFMFGAGVNSDAGVTGQIIVDERNFDLFGFPTSLDQIWNGEAFRGRGQGFRLEAVPGNRVQRYLVSFTEPYLFQSRVSLNASGFLYDRGYFDWTESRVGGRLGLGYRLTPDLSASAALRAEGVQIKNPRVIGVPALDDVLGNNGLYSGRFSLRHDTRDVPFAPTEGHLVELSYEQVFGDFEYPRGEFDYRRYFLVRERADGSGRHTISASLGAGFSGDDTPLFENYFAGGFSTIRGFEFRGASPMQSSVTVGGRFRMLGSVEYTMPVTADDMIKAVAFCDFGTVEEEIHIVTDNFRVAPGFGLRIAVPALGPAPLAFDFAFPVAQADTDETQVFSFFFGLGRG